MVGQFKICGLVVWAIVTSIGIQVVCGQSLGGISESISQKDAISVAIEQLLEIQNSDGAWPYEGVYRVRRKIPVGYRIGGTAICCQALLYGTEPTHAKANAAIESGFAMILKELKDPLMRPSQQDRYDVRVWGHIYALDLMGRLKQSGRFPKFEPELDEWIPQLTEILLAEEIKSGGWNYANQRAQAAFVTAPAVQALLWAKQSGQTIPEDVWKRAAEAMLRSRNDEGAFAYSGDERAKRPTKLPGSIARSANSEATLAMLGVARQQPLENALNAFHKYWDELEKRRKKTGTHKPPYGIAPYYFYYGHRYAAVAIGQLPEQKQATEYKRLFSVILKTRDSDGTWNDRVFQRSRAYGTAMIVLALLENRVPQPSMLPAVFLNPELLTPKLSIELSKDLTIEWEDQTLSIGELDDWLRQHPPTKQFCSIVIRVAGETKTKHVERLKTIVSREFGKTNLYVAIAE